jgi:hypothetical protein
MHLHQITHRFDSLGQQGLVCRLASGASPEAIEQAEARLRIKFPEQAACFWRTFDGLEVDVPPFKILSLSQMRREGDLVVFCVCDRLVRIAFDLSSLNEAGQWSILNGETGYRITLTMASFWSTHMWTWIVKHRPIWYDVHNASGGQQYVT